ncbi:FAD-binding oxidoreductase [Agromyces sp. SYSU K20354]|uniref:NAD(P)/FAD-dependent oxidoreductase n=1 Tax=Agromyces cavernae TaxID=2898659 RepID=UPI001E3AEB46|nr:FAD-dependent oxidoreductase [Agromyces cavernae]MCD2442458.1 FAD-binding oxidoreductase [Agromyces cavernae]
MRIAVIGAGIIGAACALELAERGAEVVIIDRVGVAGETSSRCEGNLLVSDKGPGPEADLAIHSNEQWRSLAARLDEARTGGQPATEFEAKGGVVVAFPGGEAELRRFAATQREIGIRAEELDADRLRATEPNLSPEVALAIHYPDDAQLQPSNTTQALAATAIRRGARLVVAEVTGARTEGGRIAALETTTGRIAADAVVNCAGPWAGELGERLGAPLDIRPRRGVILVTTPMPQRVFHKVYDADYVGAVGSGDAALQTSTVVESTPGGTVLIGSSRERVGFDDHPGVDPVRAIAAKAIRLFPFLADTALLRSYFGFRPYAPDHLPVIGEDPRIGGLFHATGHEGAGIGLAPATAELVAHAVLGAQTTLDPAPFLPSRAGLGVAA